MALKLLLLIQLVTSQKKALEQCAQLFDRGADGEIPSDKSSADGLTTSYLVRYSTRRSQIEEPSIRYSLWWGMGRWTDYVTSTPPNKKTAITDVLPLHIPFHWLIRKEEDDIQASGISNGLCFFSNYLAWQSCKLPHGRNASVDEWSVLMKTAIKTKIIYS